MKIEGTKSFDAPLELVWEVLNDPAQMAKLMPGVESFDVQDDAHWKANVKIPLGMGGLRFSFDFEKTEQRPPAPSPAVNGGRPARGANSTQRCFARRLAHRPGCRHAVSVDEARGIYRGEVLAIIGALADLKSDVGRLLWLAEGGDDEEEEEDLQEP